MENSLIFRLKELITKYRLNEKILIVPNLQTGHQILQHLAKESSGWINFRAATAQVLASEITGVELLKNNIEVIASMESNIIIDGIFTEMSESGRFGYFKKYTINTGIIAAITDIIIEIKMSKIFPDDLKQEYFIDPQKARDLKLIYLEYEKALTDRKLADNPDIIKKAIDLIKTGGAPDNTIKYIVLSRYRNAPLEIDFINALSSGDPIIIGEEKVYGLPKPGNRWKTEEETTDRIDLSWLFDIDNIPGDTDKGSIDLFSAATYQNEVNEVLGKMLRDNMPADKVELIYTKSQPYLSIIYNTLEKLGIPAAFSDGLPGDISRPGKALKGILLWLKEDYPEVHLRRLIKDYLIKMPEKSGPRLAHLLRTSKIGWGSARYGLILDKEIKDIQSKDDDKKYKNRLEGLLSLKDLSLKLIKLFPEAEDGMVDFGNLCSSCRDFLETFISPKDRDDAAYISNLKKRLEVLSRISERSMHLEEAVDRIFELIRQISFKTGSPRPGQILVSGLSNGGRSGREHTFILGLDSHKFPGTINRDPILLDEERKNTGSSLELSADRLKERLFDFSSILASLRGSITAGYSTYDIKDSRMLFPSSVYLQIYRLSQRDSSIDYKHLLKHLGRPSGFSSPNIIDKTGWWINRLAGGNILRDGVKSIFDIYPALSQGDKALRKRKSTTLTEYDGFIGKVDGLDPRNNKDIVLSCTAIEKYAGCPYAFFLDYVLKARRPEEITKDLLKWLDPAQRGSLLHEVFQRFGNRIKESQVKDQKKEISTILDETLKKYRLEVPIPGDAAYENEAAVLGKDLDIFLEINARLNDPHHLEFEFGYGGKEPVEIDTGTGKLRLRGKIDRVDVDSAGNYYVWDYKTGSAYSFDDNGYIDGGRQLQHILYAMVLEKALGCKVAICGYILPTEKGRKLGKGCIFERDPKDKARWQNGLNLILDLMGSGLFIISDEDNPPYIDDTDIFGTSQAKKYLKDKINDPQNEILGRWKSLKGYK